jgi:hypothetical protein
MGGGFVLVVRLPLGRLLGGHCDGPFRLILYEIG